MRQLLQNYPIQSIGLNDEKYPALLKKISDRPEIIYFRGALLPNENCFAIVGTRRASDYGKEIAFSIAKGLAEAGLIITSGMARGIDTFAHKGVLEANGRTIAILGTGLNEKDIYPQENLILAKNILNNQGCLISEYPPGTPGSKFTFPKRNRLISGLCLGVLVVEAKFGSGALITAQLAKKQERKIFAIPGSINALNSKGCHYLLKQGAKLAENVNDILKELNFQKIAAKRKTANTTEEKLISDALEQGCLHIDKIIEWTKLMPQQVSSALSLMEMENKVKNLGGNIYALTG